MKVKKAVIPAAGLGTRFLPATKSEAKEMLPVVDKPAIQYVVEEAVRAGIEDILIITSRGKRTIEDHFDRSIELETRLEQVGKFDELKEVREISDLARIHYIRQPEPLGLGAAVALAEAHVSGEPFAVLLGDDIVVSGNSLGEMIDVYDTYGRSVIAVQEVPAVGDPSVRGGRRRVRGGQPGARDRRRGEAARRGGALQPGDRALLRPDAGDLRRARASRRPT